MIAKCLAPPLTPSLFPLFAASSPNSSSPLSFVLHSPYFCCQADPSFSSIPITASLLGPSIPAAVRSLNFWYCVSTLGVSPSPFRGS